MRGRYFEFSHTIISLYKKKSCPHLPPTAWAFRTDQFQQQQQPRDSTAFACRQGKRRVRPVLGSPTRGVAQQHSGDADAAAVQSPAPRSPKHHPRSTPAPASPAPTSAPLLSHPSPRRTASPASAGRIRPAPPRPRSGSLAPCRCRELGGPYARVAASRALL